MTSTKPQYFVNIHHPKFKCNLDFTQSIEASCSYCLPITVSKTQWLLISLFPIDLSRGNYSHFPRPLVYKGKKCLYTMVPLEIDVYLEGRLRINKGVWDSQLAVALTFFLSFHFPVFISWLWRGALEHFLHCMNRRIGKTEPRHTNLQDV